MKVTIQHPQELTCQQLSQWRTLLTSANGLHHPQLQPDWAQLIVQAGLPAEIAVFEGNCGSVGFFPFARNNASRAAPISGTLTDRHAIVAACDFDLDTRELLRQCELVSWNFDHLPLGPKWLPRFQLTTDAAFSVDLSQGFEQYWSKLQTGHASWCRQLERKRKKLIREVGKLRFELRSSDTRVLDTLVEWKRRQLRETGLRDIFAPSPVRDLLARTANYSSPHFAGWLSALYAGDELVAAHLGQVSGSELNAWIPAYNVEFSQYSPGALLHLELFRSSAEEGVMHIDLGRGGNRLKMTLATGQTELAIGAIDHRALPNLLRKTGLLAKKWVQNSSQGNSLRKIFIRLRQPRDSA